MESRHILCLVHDWYLIRVLFAWGVKDMLVRGFFGRRENYLKNTGIQTVIYCILNNEAAAKGCKRP